MEEALAPRLACAATARGCAAAAALDAGVPRPGLTSLTRPRRGLDPLAVAAAAGPAYEACLCSCLHGVEARPGWAARCWLPAAMSHTERWGTAWGGALFLLSLHAAAAGRAARRGEWGRDEAVMGESRGALEAEGVEGAWAFYALLSARPPRHLYRLSWLGLPDASTPWAAEEARARGVTLAEIADKAALYDLVMRDASRRLELSLGYALPAMEETARRRGLVEALREATLTLAAEGDMLLARRAPVPPEELLAAAHSPVAEAKLWAALRTAGPGSAADVAAAAAARLIAKAWLGLAEARAYP